MSADGSIAVFLAELARLDVQLRAESGMLRCSAPEGTFTPELRSRLAERKAELLAYLDAAAGASTPVELVRVSRDEPLPLSHGQERVCELARLRPDSAAYNTSTAFRLRGALDAAALEGALDLIQRRHEILRTSFPFAGEARCQRIAPASPWVLPLLDLTKDMRRLTAERREPEILRALRARMRVPFDLERGPLWRATLLRLAHDDHVLALDLHHAIYDGGSDDVLAVELGRAYRALVAGRRPEDAPLEVQYADFACWQRRLLEGAEGRKQREFWAQRLAAGAAPLHLPVDRPRRSGSAREGRSRAFAVSGATTERLSRLARASRSGLFAPLFAALCALLHRHTGQEDQIVCTPLAARDRAELEGLIGYFNNVVPLRIGLDGDPSFVELLRAVRSEVLAAAEHQNLPFQQIAGLPGVARVPLARAMLCYQDVSRRLPRLPRLEASPIDLRRATADFELAFYMHTESDGGLRGVVEYDAGLFEDATIVTLLERFGSLLDRVAATPRTKLSELPAYGPSAEELRAALLAGAGIDDAVVVARPQTGETAAYLVLDEHDPPALEDVRDRLTGVPHWRRPVALVPLDRLPLDPAGRVDRGALPAAGARLGARSDYAPPRTATERALAQLWKRALWLDAEVGIHDDFLELGGHSLLSVQLVAAVERELGRALPLQAVARLGTVAEMARALDGEEDDGAAPGAASPELAPDVHRAMLSYTASWRGLRVTPESLIVGRNADGERRPLFWCLQRHAELDKLAEYVGEDQPVYGMRSANRVMVKTPENLAALAAHYASEVLQVQPCGPFLLGGNCQAAQIAFELAERLRGAGHEVGLLIMLEKFVPRPYAGPIAMLFGAESDRNPYRRYRHPEIGWRKYYGDRWTFDRVSGRHARFFQEPNVQVLAETIRRRIDERGAGAPVDRKGGAPQVLSAAARRATLRADVPGRLEPGSSVVLTVEVTNDGPETWLAGERSGITLADRWSLGGDEVQWNDGRSWLPRNVPPGERVRVDLEVTAPSRPGSWTLELDLVDEGITWFHEEGSRAFSARVEVLRPSLLGTLRRYVATKVQQPG